VLNPNIVMQCGKIVFDWALLSDIAFARASKRMPSLVSSQLSLEVMRAARDAGQSLTLFKALRLCRQLSCTNPRDRVYGMLGIASDEAKTHIKVEYTRSVEDIYTDAALAVLLTDEQPMLLLSNVVCDSTLSLTSWVPDWSLGSVNNPLGARKCYKAAGDTHAVFEVPNRDQLRLAGSLVAEVS